jgi:ADP-ribose pyrophosphatase YjhB (NUDIX family)
MTSGLEYPDSVIPPFRYQFCPMCKTRLIRKVLFDDGIPLITCPNCSWICTRTNSTGVVTVATCDKKIAVILPPGLPPETPAAMPAGLIEYGESPEEAAVRETLEETGLETEVVRCLGWFFLKSITEWPGPLIQFMFESRVVGGELRGSSEGEARFFTIDAFPDIIYPERTGSWRAITNYLSNRAEKGWR